jgi:hypothetical protein
MNSIDFEISRVHKTFEIFLIYLKYIFLSLCLCHRNNNWKSQKIISLYEKQLTSEIPELLNSNCHQSQKLYSYLIVYSFIIGYNIP